MPCPAGPRAPEQVSGSLSWAYRSWNMSWSLRVWSSEQDCYSHLNMSSVGSNRMRRAVFPLSLLCLQQNECKVVQPQGAGWGDTAAVDIAVQTPCSDRRSWCLRISLKAVSHGGEPDWKWNLHRAQSAPAVCSSCRKSRTFQLTSLVVCNMLFNVWDSTANNAVASANQQECSLWSSVTSSVFQWFTWDYQQSSDYRDSFLSNKDVFASTRTE